MEELKKLLSDWQDLKDEYLPSRIREKEISSIYNAIHIISESIDESLFGQMTEEDKKIVQEILDFHENTSLID